MIEFYKQVAIPRAPIVGEGRRDDVAAANSACGHARGGGRVDSREAGLSQVVLFAQCEEAVFSPAAQEWCGEWGGERLIKWFR